MVTAPMTADHGPSSQLEGGTTPLLDYAQRRPRHRIPWLFIGRVLLVFLLTVGSGAAGYFGQPRRYSFYMTLEVLPQAGPATTAIEHHRSALKSTDLLSRAAAAAHERWKIPIRLAPERLETWRQSFNGENYIFITYEDKDPASARWGLHALIRTYWESLPSHDELRIMNSSNSPILLPRRNSFAIYGAAAGLTVASFLGFVRARKRRRMSGTC